MGTAVGVILAVVALIAALLMTACGDSEAWKATASPRDPRWANQNPSRTAQREVDEQRAAFWDSGPWPLFHEYVSPR